MVPTCHSCGFVNTFYLDYTPDWKTLKTTHEETSAPLASSMGGIASIHKQSVLGSAPCSSGSLPTITTLLLSNYIDNPSSTPVEPEVYYSERPPRRKKVTFPTVASATPGPAPFKPSINNRTFYDHCQHISQIGAHCCLPKVVIDRAIWWYKESLQRYKFHGYVCDALKAASVYIASSEYQGPVTQKVAADMFQASKTYVTKCINMLQKHRVGGNVSEIAKPVDYIQLFLTRLQHQGRQSFTMDQQMLCFFVAEKVHAREWATDNYPYCVAATILYLVSYWTTPDLQHRIPKKKVCEICQTSEVTLNRCYNKLSIHLSSLIPSSLMTPPRDRLGGPSRLI
jgi:hypothetical protein